MGINVTMWPLVAQGLSGMGWPTRGPIYSIDPFCHLLLLVFKLIRLLEKKTKFVDIISGRQVVYVYPWILGAHLCFQIILRGIDSWDYVINSCIIYQGNLFTFVS